VQKSAIFLISIPQVRKNISHYIPPSHICQIAYGGWKQGVHLNQNEFEVRVVLICHDIHNGVKFPVFTAANIIPVCLM
jgi:hypothetical protein